MGIKLIHVSDIHLGAGEGHGRVNPETGLNVRLEDFARALSRTVDHTIDSRADVFLFSGDAYRNASPEPVYQKVFAAALKRLSDAGIRTVLLVGNHDQLLKSSASHAMSVFQSLEVPGVITIDRPMLLRLDTAGGTMQLIGIPHVTRHQLVTHPEYASLPADAVDRVLVDHVQAMLRGYYDQLDPTLPAVVTAHMTVDRALAGIEQELLVGYTLTFPTDIFIDERVDYVALGHVHKHQIIRDERPTIVYAGSLERVDFGEQDEDKGFVEVDLERGRAVHSFHSIGPRPFVTVDADLSEANGDLTARLCDLVRARVTDGCVLRVRYRVAQTQLDQVDEDEVRAVAGQALSVRMQPEIIPVRHRARMPQLNESTASAPVAALETYLREVAPERTERLLSLARELSEEAGACE